MKKLVFPENTLKLPHAQSRMHAMPEILSIIADDISR